MKSLTPIALAWFAALVVLFVFATPLGEKLFFFYPLLHWGVVLAGAVIAVAAAWRCRRQLREGLPAVVIVAVGLALFFTSGYRIGRLAYFQIRKSHYEELLAEATRLGDVPAGSGNFDEGPPPRFAFYWWRGVTDNWAGMVHDPSGDVMRVNEKGGVENLREGKYSELSTMFGGTFYRCEHMQGDWYLCWFT